MGTEELLATLRDWLSGATENRTSPDTARFAAVARQVFQTASREQAYEALSPFVLAYQDGNEGLGEAAQHVLLALTESPVKLQRDPRWLELGLRLYEDRPRFLVRLKVAQLLQTEHPQRQALLAQAIDRLSSAPLLERLLTTNPLLEGVSEEICTRYSLETILTRPPNASLSAMKLNRKAIDEILEALGSRADEVTELSFAYRHLNQQAMEALSGHAGLGHFRRLSFNHSQIKNTGLKQLLKSPHLGRLEHLDVGCCGLTKPAIDALAKAKTLPALKSLVLECREGSGDKGGAAEQAALIASKTLRLERLALRGWDPVYPEAFASCELVRGLKELDLSRMELRRARTDVSLMGHLARAESPIQALDFSSCYFHFGESPTDWNSFSMGGEAVPTEPMPGLVRLALNDCGFDGQMLAVLCKANFLPQLKELSLQRSKLRAGDFGPLLESTDVALEVLDLSGALDDFKIDALEELAHWPRASALKQLILRHTNLRAGEIERVPQLKAAMLAGGWPAPF